MKFLVCSAVLVLPVAFLVSVLPASYSFVHRVCTRRCDLCTTFPTAVYIVLLFVQVCVFARVFLSPGLCGVIGVGS